MINQNFLIASAVSGMVAFLGVYTLNRFNILP